MSIGLIQTNRNGPLGQGIEHSRASFALAGTLPYACI